MSDIVLGAGETWCGPAHMAGTNMLSEDTDSKDLQTSLLNYNVYKFWDTRML